MSQVVADAQIEVTLTLSSKMVERLKVETAEQQVTLSSLVNQMLEDYLDELDEDEEYEDTPDEEILADLREALEDVIAGRTYPADEVFAEIRERRNRQAHDDQS